MTIRNGNAGSYDAGGVLIEGTVTMDKVRLVDNKGASGGGAQVEDGTLTIQNSLVDNNTATYQGGGLHTDYYDNGTGTMNIINTTITHNRITYTVATIGGGGVAFRGSGGTITNSTIAYNTIADGTAEGAGVYYNPRLATSLSIKNSIIASNYVGGGPLGTSDYDISKDAGTITDGGYNVVGKNNSTDFSPESTTWIDGTSSVDGTFTRSSGGSGSLYLSSTLDNNSSIYATETYALTDASSIAIDNGTTGTNGSISIPTKDQRGADRVNGTDIGAYEYGGTPGEESDSEESSGGGIFRTLTKPNSPSIYVTALKGFKAKVNGAYLAGSAITESIGFIYWHENESERTLTLDGIPSAFSYIIGSLECGKNYSIKAFAKNSLAISYSNTETFSTDVCEEGELKTTEEAPENSTSAEEAIDEGLLKTLRLMITELLESISANKGAPQPPVPAELASVKNLPTRDLELGDEGEDVAALQRFLIMKNSGPSAAELKRTGASGYFGNYTKNALGEFQFNAGIKPYAGYYGAITRKYLLSL